MKWNETREEKRKKRKNQKKKKKVIEISGVTLFLSYLRILSRSSSIFFFRFPLSRKLDVSSYPKGFIFLSVSLSFLSLYDIIDILSTGINSIELYTHTHTHTLTFFIPLHSSNVWKRRKRGLQEDTATRSRRPSRESTLKKPVVCPVSIIGRQLITRHVARHINENPSVTRAASRRGLIIIKRNDVAETGSEAERFSTWRIERERERETCLEIGWIGLDEIMHLSRGDFSSFSKEILEEIKELIESIREYY